MIHPPAPAPAPAPAVRNGDRVAFATLDSDPRALCGVVVETEARNVGDQPRMRIIVGGREFLAAPGSVRKLA